MVGLKDIKTFSVIGAGTMGHEIAQVALMAGFERVFLNDLNKEILKNASDKIKINLEKLHHKGKLERDFTPQILMKRLIPEINLSKAISEADFIVEAIPEVMELKQKLFSKLGEYSPVHTIIATNTSTMSITKIAEFSKKPDKVIGMHFFTPIVVLRLIELIKGEKTSQNTFELAARVGMSLPALKGKRYIAKIEKESPGFIVNRLTIASSLYLNWLLDKAVDNGIPIEKVDNDFINPPELGPYAKWDYLGLDVVCDSMNYFAKNLSSEFKPGKTLTNLLKEGNLGRKTGKGLYKWISGKPILKTTEKAGLANVEYYFAIQLNEGCKLLDEGIVSGYKTIDDTMVAGMDMPGPFGAGRRNFKKWTKLLEELSERTSLTYLKPCELMKSGDFLKMRT